MAITINDLILFNNVESTDLVQGITKIPYAKPLTFVRGRTYTSGYQDLVEGANGRGTKVLIRKLGKGGATHAKANTSGAFRYTHDETPDSVIEVPIDDVIKQSEEVFEAVDLARVSATGGLKAEIVMNNLIELSQAKISEGLEAVLPALDNTDAVTAANVKEIMIDAIAKEVSHRPTVMLVSRAVYAELLKLQTTGDFVANFESIYTGFVGRLLGVDVYINEDFPADVDFALYNHNYFNVFEMLQFFDFVPATDFNGSYIRGLWLQGTHGETGLDVTNGAWGVIKKNA